MELVGSLFVVLALIVIVALYVSRPLILPGSHAAETPVVEEDHVRSSLMAERDRIMNALQELDFDNALGKIPTEDYPTQRAALMRSGALVLRRLDALGPAGYETTPGSSAISKGSGSVEDRIEAAIAARRADAVMVPDVPRNGGARKDALEDLIAQRKRERKESAAGFCPHCGKPVQKSDKFCARCGTTL